ncbi:MAG: hypothetical protein QW303_00060 [Nitrososphaerota archaeon]
MNISNYLLIDIWSYITPKLDRYSLLSFALCSREMLNFVSGFQESFPLFLNTNMCVKDFSEMLRKRRKHMSYRSIYSCVRKYLDANRDVLHGKDTYRVMKLLNEVDVPYLYPLRFVTEMFEVITSDSFQINEKNEQRVFELIAEHIKFAKTPLLGRNLKFPLRFRTIEVVHRLNMLEISSNYEEDIEKILLDSLYVGEEIYVCRFAFFTCNEEKISTCAEKVGIFLHYKL